MRRERIGPITPECPPLPAPAASSGRPRCVEESSKNLQNHAPATSMRSVVEEARSKHPQMHVYNHIQGLADESKFVLTFSYAPQDRHSKPRPGFAPPHLLPRQTYWAGSRCCQASPAFWIWRREADLWCCCWRRIPAELHKTSIFKNRLLRAFTISWN